MTAPRLPFDRFFQLGYVTRDLDAATALYAQRYGVERFHVFDSANVRVALAYRGATMLEFIEPDVRQSSLYGEALKGDSLITLHHLGHWVSGDAFDGLPEQCRALSIEVPVYWKSENLFVCYADTRADNGLFSEFIYVPDATVGLFAAVPQNQPKIPL